MKRYWLCRISLLVIVLGLLPACRASVALPTTPVAGLPVLRLEVEPDAGVLPIVKELNSAQKTIRMTMYLLTERDIIDALKAARGRGVDVRVLLEAQPVGGGTGNKPALNDLQAANVSVKTSNPAFRLTHQKTLVVDERVALILTANATRAAFTANREYGIVDTDPNDVAEIVAVFEADWKRTAPVLANSNLVWSPVNARARLLGLIDGAQKTLDLETEELQDREVETHLIDAVTRGVVARVVMSPRVTGATDANVAGQERITRGGAQLRLVKTPYIHAKILVADNARAFVGSQNLSTTSLDLNRELGLLVTDPSIVQTLAATFASDWNIGK